MMIAGSEMAPPKTAATAQISVIAYGRLHLGFFDPNASLGRAFGSVGLVIDDPVTAVQLVRAPSDRASAVDGAAHALERAVGHIERLRRSTGKRDALALRLSAAIPAHAGLGSGTQLALAVGRAFAQLHEWPILTPALAAMLERGRRSGVGVAGFDHGGLIIDGGPSPANDVAPILARYDFPADWRILLIRDPAAAGLHGHAEARALTALPALPQAAAAHLCHLMLMRVMPAVCESAFAPFAAGISEIQQILGRHFAPAQGGDPFTSPAVARVLRWITERATAATGQSSWGPTGFAILPTAAAADDLRRRAQAAGVVAPGLQLSVVAARNRGATIESTLVAGAVGALERSVTSSSY